MKRTISSMSIVVIAMDIDRHYLHIWFTSKLMYYARNTSKKRGRSTDNPKPFLVKRNSKQSVQHVAFFTFWRLDSTHSTKICAFSQHAILALKSWVAHYRTRWACARAIINSHEQMTQYRKLPMWMNGQLFGTVPTAPYACCKRIFEKNSSLIGVHWKKPSERRHKDASSCSLTNLKAHSQITKTHLLMRDARRWSCRQR